MAREKPRFLAAGGVAGRGSGGPHYSPLSQFPAHWLYNCNIPDGFHLNSIATITANWRRQESDRWWVPVGLGKALVIGKPGVPCRNERFGKAI
ncbi:hypothetical protein [Accumulibacter sp.]|uniref:hypothetical protein n=1 Tax=Accumulibacter sp. TaxID=2053492 RepID=UPI0035B1D7B0